MLLLLQGQYQQGWQDYEWRHHVPRAGGGLLAHPPGRRWDGSTALAAGEPLLLVAEQGLGDTLQFARYVLPLREWGLSVRLCAQPPLHGLLRSSGLEPAPLSPAQAEAWTGPWLPLLSLPGVLGVSAEDPIVNAPYLAVEPERIARWRALLASSPGPRIALAWQGNPAAEQTTLRGRSLPLEAFAAFARRSEACFVALQKGFGAEQLAVCSFRDRFVAAQERIEQTWDFLDTAAILHCCDLVLTSDTALAHLAGGLGCPTWLLLPHQPEWRWGLQGDSSPWYPCLRLWRQGAPGDWGGPLGRVSEEFQALRQLQSLLAGGDAALEAPQVPAEPEPGPEPEPRSAFAARLGAEGRWGELESFARQRLLEDPQDPEAHSHLGIARQQLDDAAEAVVHLQRALALRPDHAPYLLNLGNARQRLGDLPAAIACYRHALQQRPDAPELQRLLGQALLRADEPESALPHLEQALRLQPQEAEISNSLGQARFALGDAQGALADFRRALALRPEDPGILCNLGTALQQLGDHAAADPCFALALQRQPDFAEAHNNLGVGLQLQGRLQESIEQFGRALTLQPNYADAYSNLGNTLMEAGAHAAALDSFRSALAVRSDHGDAHHNLGMALLLLGDYRRGWAEYEWRGRCSVPVVPHAIPPTRVWDGSPLAPGETLLLVCEQGLGDTLQFMRYALPLRQRSIPVRLCAQTNLHGILRSSGIDPDPLSPEQAASYSHGPWIPLLSLPGLLGVSPDNPLHTSPYIHVPPERIALWRSRLAHAPRPLLALHWQGNPAHESSAGRGRSLPLESFAVLAQRTPASFLSLQKGHGAEQLPSCSFRHRFLPAQDLIDPTWDFLDIAAILLCCDLVLTSDSALAHLAGGLGCPTWLLLKHQPEWRWGLHGESSPWYPSLRLCRQTTPGHWNQLLASLSDDLLTLCQLQGLTDGRQEEPAPILAPVSLGELVDKITILDIKNEHLQGPALVNVQRERQALRRTLDALPLAVEPALVEELHATNASLWSVEDALREHERRQDFGEAFVELARSVYRLNDRRAALKKRINLLAGSALIEEKSYAAY
jgi:tetratricopeptide (TPR) repeat protein/ADP-heptose:LPS heptosyltransferase